MATRNGTANGSTKNGSTSERSGTPASTAWEDFDMHALGGDGSADKTKEKAGKMNTNDTTTTKNGSSVTGKTGAKELASRIGEKIDPQSIVDGAKRLPEIIQREVKENPYRTLGIAAGVGFGVGAIMSSRIARLLLITAGGYAVNELARGRIKAFIDELADEE